MGLEGCLLMMFPEYLVTRLQTVTNSILWIGIWESHFSLSMTSFSIRFTVAGHTQRRQWQPPPVLLPGKSQGRGSLVGCRLWGRTESDTTEVTWQQQLVILAWGSKESVESCILMVYCWLSQVEIWVYVFQRDTAYSWQVQRYYLRPKKSSSFLLTLPDD